MEEKMKPTVHWWIEGGRHGHPGPFVSFSVFEENWPNYKVDPKTLGIGTPSSCESSIGFCSGQFFVYGSSFGITNKIGELFLIITAHRAFYTLF